VGTRWSVGGTSARCRPGRGAENGVGQGVRHRIGVRVSPPAASMRNLHAAEDELPAFPSANRCESYPIPTRMSGVENAERPAEPRFGVIDSRRRRPARRPALYGGEQRIETRSAARPRTALRSREIGERGGESGQRPPTVPPRRSPPGTLLPGALHEVPRSWSGWRWAEDTWNSYETPALLRTSKAGSIRGLSLSEPTT